jgi:hypothetical protein
LKKKGLNEMSVTVNKKDLELALKLAEKELEMWRDSGIDTSSATKALDRLWTALNAPPPKKAEVSVCP